MRTTTRSSRAFVAALAAVSGLAGCALVAGLHDRSLEAGGEGGADAGSGADAPGDGAAEGAADSTMPRPPAEGGSTSDASCGIVYVSTKGSDQSSGCSQGAPKATIASAISAVEMGAGGPEVHVCEGTYFETNLTVQSAVTIRGGYACDTWGRPTGFGGYPLDGAVAYYETIIESSDASGAQATLTVRGSPGIDAGSFTLEGLKVVGPAADAVSSSGALVQNAGPMITQDLFVAGQGSETTYALRLASAPAEVKGSWMTFVSDGGTGTSVALNIELVEPTERPNIHDNLIQGGSTTTDAGNGSVALYANLEIPDGEAPNPAVLMIQDNVIQGGAGATLDQRMTSFGPALSSVGVTLSGRLTASLVGNLISGGLPVGQSAGVVAGPGAAVSLEGNRIYGGNSSSPGGPDAVSGTAGVLLDAPASLIIYNNMIHGGYSAGGDAFGLWCNMCVGAVFEDNTLFAGWQLQGQGGLSSFALRLTGGGSENVLIGNILAGSPSTLIYGAFTEGYALSVDGCPSELGQHGLAQNLFLDAPAGIVDCNDTSTPPTASDDITFLDDTFNGTGDLTYAYDCTARDTTMGYCIQPAGSCDPSCLSDLTTWDEQSGGFNSLFSTTGWALNAGDPCAIMAGGLDLAQQDAGPDIPTDINGTARPDAPAIGAYQPPPGTSCAQ
jgi:hypothetical protein